MVIQWWHFTKKCPKCPPTKKKTISNAFIFAFEQKVGKILKLNWIEIISWIWIGFVLKTSREILDDLDFWFYIYIFSQSTSFRWILSVFAINWDFFHLKSHPCCLSYPCCLSDNFIEILLNFLIKFDFFLIFLVIFLDRFY